MDINRPNTEDELVNAIKDLLKKNGHLHKLQAELRAKVTEALLARQMNLKCGDNLQSSSSPPAPTDEVLLVNELVREYLEWNGYLYTASVMLSEAAMPKESKTRNDLCAQVGVRDDERSSSLPLLSNIVAAYTERIKRKISKSKKEPNA